MVGPFAGRARLVAVLQAVANLDAVVREHKFKDVCLRAYGLPEDTPDDEAVEKIRTHNPLPRLRALRDTALPRTAIYHGFKDANIPAETNAIPLANALRRAGGEVELNIFPDVEHNVYGMGKEMEDRLRTFFSAL